MSTKENDIWNENMTELKAEKHYCKLHSFVGTETDRETCPDCNSCEDCGQFLGDSTVATCKCGKYSW